MSARLFLLFFGLVLAGGATAQGRKHIDKAADLPRFSYKLDGKIEDMVRDDAKFKPFAREVRRDLESVLAKYDIDDKATLRQILGELAQLDLLDGDYEAALARVAQVKALRGQAGRQAPLRDHAHVRLSPARVQARTARPLRTGPRSRQSITGRAGSPCPMR